MQYHRPPKIVVGVQARMGSKRLPQKTLLMIKDDTVLGHIVSALLNVTEPKNLFVLTSSDQDCDRIDDFCGDRHITCVRGDEDNVAARYLKLIDLTDCDYFIRISGDSPLIDHRIVTAALEYLSVAKPYDLITTVGGGYPSGMNVELVNCYTYKKQYTKFNKQADFEHVTNYFYEAPEQFNINILQCPLDQVATKYKFSLDTKQDLFNIEKFFNCLKQPHSQYDLKEKCEIYDELFLKEKQN